MDAVTARRAAERDAPVRVRLYVAGERADGRWAGILDTPRGSAPCARPVPHRLNPPVREIGSLGTPEPLGTATGALYGQAPRRARRPLRPAGPAPLGRAFIGLLARATHGEGDGR
ncbi:hypothetical protein ACF1GS_25025 [Streptomyces eurythermus]|uniref:hypothetical protein n=1 Tax=Streptomyces eurythermus TaxID=42237 RepID=UPI00279C91F4|nr:hypothetical protein J3S85_24210 [Streptomyces lavenduligriseus]